VSDDEDGELVRKAADGNDAAFAELAERYRTRAFGTASRFARGRAELEDLTQDIFIRAWKGLKSYRSDAPFEHWFMTIAVRTCYDFLRKNRKRRENEVLVEESPADLYADSADCHDETIHRRREAWEVIDRILTQLNEKERLIITLMELEEKTVKETSALTGWSESNVKVRAHRARNKMREIFEEQQQLQHEHRQNLPSD
jgi:RNA polymerase sigma-70 factor (ECF subfamily)